MSVLSLRGLTVTIQTPTGPFEAVRGVDLNVARGETVGIVGESGSGKSVTSLAIMRLLSPRVTVDATEMRLGDIDLRTLSERRMADLRGDRMAMIFQEPMTALNPVLTVGRQLTETWLRHRATGKREATERAVDLLDRVGIPRARARMNVYPHQLSGGLRQRVMIAMALLCDPDLLIADEPTTALDVTVQAQILDLLAGLQQERGLAMVFISHDIGVVARIAQRVQVMHGGRTVDAGPVGDLLTRPQHAYTRALLSAVPRRGMRWGRERLGAVEWSGDDEVTS
ncbi:MAG: ABC transporter ATP-binding protein [Desulfomicrobium sp.]|uniref:ABC transporter ATP-binding protein n=1 Tax=Hoeflea sp. TaxID=1940281 RepID=UPI0025BDB254|nr:ABC transporter ATP-binding protein [Hoeflea sp.]MBU4527153.1 ABC transporter ATP-binding protein [Alphaproteobacteria bacterium]MBV1713923.1 ABC transporter ATP-binding protein [Desulfomicrobium sp.]MBU4544135.1 ABC transporter ATP-binding protein [Alphaproteobacteria bacterium]MBU4552335.1 ABC transporter ATP-binding protein [Alphaproteobacteria bacterium]MBV1786204.1 ABC transporter ATP-binding protein [Hoeflea sp.]